jgi:hypothetical protein
MPQSIAWRVASEFLSATILVASLACSDSPVAPPGPMPIISLTLVEGESLQVAFVTVGTPADSTIPLEGVPAPSGQVTLRVEDDSGHVWPLVATTPGRFSAALSPRRGARYHLAGTAMGRQVVAHTRVPAFFTLVAPSGDTLTATDAFPCTDNPLDVEVCVRAEVAFDGAIAIGYVGVGQVGPWLERGLLRSTTQEIRFLRSEAVRDVVFTAYNEDAAAWLWSSTARSSVSGAFGGFGAALVLRRKVHLP